MAGENGTTMVTLNIARPDRRGYLVGCGLVALAGLLWSFGTLTVRAATEADAWQYMIYRALGQLSAMLLWGRLRGRPAGLQSFTKAGPLVWIGSVLVAGSALAYVAALKMTVVANVMLLTATAPLWTAVFAALLLGEVFDRYTVAALAVGALGIAVMVQGDFGAGDMIGNGLALGAALCFSFYSLCLRAAGTRDLEPVVLGFAVVALAGGIAGTLIAGRPLLVPPADMAAGFLHGFVLMGVGMLLFVRSAPLTPAAEMSILSQTETIFGPVWVWLAFGETPGRATLAGGALIMAAVIIKAVSGARKPPARVAD